MRNKYALGCFLFGLGCQLQIVASLSFTELFSLLMAPCIISSEWYHMKKNGILPFFLLSVLTFIGCIVACVFNHTEPLFVLRGLAVTSILPCAIVTSHWMLRRDPAGFKWMIVGGVASSFLCTFIFQKSVEVSIASQGMGGSSARGIMAGAVYWKNRITGLLSAPIRGWYLQCPLWISFCVPLFLSGFSLLVTASGRGSALCALATAFMVLIGGKKQRTMQRIGRHFVIVLFVGLMLSLAYKAFYTYAAPKGILGEESRKKYERQTHGDTSLGKLLLGGRMEAFCGLLAAVDRPIVGFGPWAKDEKGYTAEFLYKYGTVEDYNTYKKEEAYRQYSGYAMINCHSHITMFWVWYGIFGLLFWLYVIYVILRYIRTDCWAVPQWYMWLACSAPSYIWDVCFNPLDNRVGSMLFVVACLMARAFRLGRVQLPWEMIREIEETERK